MLPSGTGSGQAAPPSVRPKKTFKASEVFGDSSSDDEETPANDKNACKLLVHDAALCSVETTFKNT